ncbi:unnamed protein product [Pleuronectes platessa]|uniref:Uncharacterized protein n=1 Tax=Pleuronectes platessa TaxID=8262 RepID=A0A9N7UTZ7_PLEPL|nr:unnamed protein product [Pleuronectes platessa]
MSSGCWLHVSGSLLMDLSVFVYVSYEGDDVDPGACRKSSVMSRAGEQRRRCQSMKSYPSSELRNVCDEQNAVIEPAEEGEELLKQMLVRRHAPYPNLYPDQSPSEEWTMEERFRPLTFHGLILRSQSVNLLIRGVCYAENQSPPPRSWSNARTRCQRDTGSATTTTISPHDTESATLGPPPRPPVRDQQTAIHGAATEALDLQDTCCVILDKL